MASLTRALCEAVVDLAARPVPADVASMARRSLTNVAGTAVGAAEAAATDAVVAVFDRGGGAGTATVPGRPERLDPYAAALATGVAAHLDDFDDTHLHTVIHPAASGFATLLSLATTDGDHVADPALLRAFALGCEVQLRLGNAVSPSHYDLGWHITGTCGVVGAAVTAALAWGLGIDGVVSAVGLACQATLGQREAFGSMAKAWHVGKAAEQGLLAAALARAGHRTRDDAIDGPGGFLAVLADRTDPTELLAGIGSRWELLTNTFKPYPCGIVSHPVIDAALAVSSQVDTVENIRAVDIACHPLVTELMGATDPGDGLQGRFSAAHTCAAALADGELTLDQFDDDRVARSDVARLRAVTTFHPDPGVHRDEATVSIGLVDGRRLREHVSHARGSLARPLTDGELRAKVIRLVERVLPGHGAMVWSAGMSLDEPGGFLRLSEALVPPRRTVEAP